MFRLSGSRVISSTTLARAIGTRLNHKPHTLSVKNYIFSFPCTFRCPVVGSRIKAKLIHHKLTNALLNTLCRKDKYEINFNVHSRQISQSGFTCLYAYKCFIIFFRDIHYHLCLNVGRHMIDFLSYALDQNLHVPTLSLVFSAI